MAEGKSVREIALTHVHPDHRAGATALSDHLQRKHRKRVPVAAHRLTAQSLRNQLPVDRFIEDSDVLALDGEPSIRLRALYTPGHARGHLCFHDERTGALISGDNIVGFGSVLIDPPEGNMRDYLDSLKRMRELTKLTVLFGVHGPACSNSYKKIYETIIYLFVS